MQITSTQTHTICVHNRAWSVMVLNVKQVSGWKVLYRGAIDCVRSEKEGLKSLRLLRLSREVLFSTVYSILPFPEQRLFHLLYHIRTLSTAFSTVCWLLLLTVYHSKTKHHPKIAITKRWYCNKA